MRLFKRLFFIFGTALGASLLWAPTLSHAVSNAIPNTTSNAITLAHTAPKRTFNVPPSADLNYAVRAHQSGITLSGNALLTWRASADKYSVDTETRAALMGKIIETKSAGSIDGFGLAPSAFIEKRWRKDPSTTAFNRSSKLITFTNDPPPFPLLGGEQDRASVIWQLIAVARGNSATFKPNSVWDFFVAGTRDAEPWTFTVIREESLATALGTQRTVHISRAPPPDSKAQRLDIWLAPALEWYPVRIRFSDGSGDSIEQVIEKISKPAA